MPAIREEFVTACVEAAKDSVCTNKHAALVVRGRRVLALSTNIRKTHVRNFEYGRIKGIDVTCETHHAEPRSLMRANEEGRNHHIQRLLTKGAVLYSFRDALEKPSKPCKRCLKMAQRRGIALVVFSNGTGSTCDRVDSLLAGVHHG